jgi:hypothetical protein
MSYNDPLADYPNDALSPLEVERVREIVGFEALSTVASLVADLTPEQRQATRFDIDQWINRVGEGTDRIQGGSSGADVSRERDRTAIRARLARRLGLEVGAIAATGLFRIGVGGSCADDEEDLEY